MKTCRQLSVSSTLNRDLTIACLFFIVTGCSALPKGTQQSLTGVTPVNIDFREIEYYALRSKASYGSPSEIKRRFPNTTRVTTVQPVNVQYFLETDERQKNHTIAIRGTANKKNVWQDVEVLMVKDDHLGFRLHKGFRDTSLDVYNDVKPHLNKGYNIRVTGHSLGGAVALILTNYLYRDGYQMERLVTFGQPKVTGDKSDYDYKRDLANKRITRVAYYEDPVALMPPAGLAVRYGHVGPELILREGPDYVFLPAHDADRISVGGFWRNFGRVEVREHFMTVYLENIRGKIENGSRQVPYKGS